MRPSPNGTISELLVCADLLRMGYEVFWAVSPTASCDLIATKGDAVFRVEVKTGHERLNGKPSHSKPRPWQKFNVLAVAFPASGKVTYDGSFP